MVQITITPTPSAPVNSPTPTPTPTPSSTPAPGVSITPSPTVSITPSLTSTASITPTPTVTRTQTSTVTVTPSVSPVTFRSYSFAAEFYSSGTPSVPDIYGYSQDFEVSLITPIDFKSYGVRAIMTNKFINSSDITFKVIIQNASGTTIPPINALTKVQFTDKDGIFRQYFTVDASYSNQSSIGVPSIIYTWASPSTLFNPGSNYIILLE